jgi:hypothetical protein
VRANFSLGRFHRQRLGEITLSFAAWHKASVWRLSHLYSGSSKALNKHPIDVWKGWLMMAKDTLCAADEKAYFFSEKAQ